jgi:hypothetical protein
MINNNVETEQVTENEKPQDKKPDESSGIFIQAHVKIFDPESEEVFFAGRA